MVGGSEKNEINAILNSKLKLELELSLATSSQGKLSLGNQDRLESMFTRLTCTGIAKREKQ